MKSQYLLWKEKQLLIGGKGDPGWDQDEDLKEIFEWILLYAIKCNHKYFTFAKKFNRKEAPTN